MDLIKAELFPSLGICIDGLDIDFDQGRAISKFGYYDRDGWDIDFDAVTVDSP